MHQKLSVTVTIKILFNKIWSRTNERQLFSCRIDMNTSMTTCAAIKASCFVQHAWMQSKADCCFYAACETTEHLHHHCGFDAAHTCWQCSGMPLAVALLQVKKETCHGHHWQCEIHCTVRQIGLVSDAQTWLHPCKQPKHQSPACHPTNCCCCCCCCPCHHWLLLLLSLMPLPLLLPPLQKDCLTCSLWPTSTKGSVDLLLQSTQQGTNWKMEKGVEQRAGNLPGCMGCQNWCFTNWVMVMASKTVEPTWKPTHRCGLPAAVPVAAWVVLSVVHSFDDSPWPHCSADWLGRSRHCCRPGWEEAVPLEGLHLQQHFDKDLLAHQNCGAALQSGNPLVNETIGAKVVDILDSCSRRATIPKKPQKKGVCTTWATTTVLCWYHFYIPHSVPPVHVCVETCVCTLDVWNLVHNKIYGRKMLVINSW